MRGESDARGIAHGFGQVVEQLVQKLAKAVDGLALQPQARITKLHDRADAHPAEYIEGVGLLPGYGRRRRFAAQLPPGMSAAAASFGCVTTVTGTRTLPRRRLGTS